MQTHIAQTIESISAKIDALTTCRNALILAFGEPSSTPIRPIPPKPAPTARKSSIVNRKSKAPRRSDAFEHNTSIAAKLRQPFTGIVLSKALGLTKNGGASQINRWLVAGLVKRVGFGQYERTAKFPNSQPSTPQPSTVHVPGLDPEPKGTIQEQLEKALKDRDAAVSAGQDRLAKILQDKVDHLTAQLG